MAWTPIVYNPIVVTNNNERWAWGKEKPLPMHPLLRSALLLAGTNAIISCGHMEARQGHQLPHCATCGRSGLVTALEVAELDLAGTELAVLSACSSGFGVAARHEGHLGLRSALHQAGAHAALVSLWPVPDGWTHALMVAFYRRLVEGMGRLAALRVAQAEVREAGAPVAAWAAFVLVGDPSPLRRLKGYRCSGVTECGEEVNCRGG